MSIMVIITRWLPHQASWNKKRLLKNIFGLSLEVQMTFLKSSWKSSTKLSHFSIPFALFFFFLVWPSKSPVSSPISVTLFRFGRLFFVCVFGERFVQTATQLCTTPPPLHSLLFSLSLSPPLLLPLLTPNKQMEEGVVECGQLLCWFAVVVGARARLPFSFSQFKFGERGYRLAGGVVLNRKKHLWGFSFDNGWRDWVLPWSVSVGVSEDWGFFSFFCGGPFSRWSQFCLLSFGENLAGVRRYGGGNCSRSDLVLAIYNKYVRFFGKVFCWAMCDAKDFRAAAEN